CHAVAVGALHGRPVRDRAACQAAYPDAAVPRSRPQTAIGRVVRGGCRRRAGCPWRVGLTVLLSITGEKKIERTNDRTHFSERSCGSFTCSFGVPAEADRNASMRSC